MTQMTKFHLIVLLCLVMPCSLYAASGESDEPATPLTRTLSAYAGEGYEILGPIQYLGKTDEVLEFYRHESTAFDSLDIINQFREPWFVRPEDFVYVLSKDGHLILIRIHQKETDANAR